MTDDFATTVEDASTVGASIGGLATASGGALTLGASLEGGGVFGTRTMADGLWAARSAGGGAFTRGIGGTGALGFEVCEGKPVLDEYT